MACPGSICRGSTTKLFGLLAPPQRCRQTCGVKIWRGAGKNSPLRKSHLHRELVNFIASQSPGSSRKWCLPASFFLAPLPSFRQKKTSERDHGLHLQTSQGVPENEISALKGSQEPFRREEKTSFLIGPSETRVYHGLSIRFINIYRWMMIMVAKEIQHITIYIYVVCIIYVICVYIYNTHVWWYCFQLGDNHGRWLVATGWTSKYIQWGTAVIISRLQRTCLGCCSCNQPSAASSTELKSANSGTISQGADFTSSKCHARPKI